MRRPTRAAYMRFVRGRRRAVSMLLVTAFMATAGLAIFFLFTWWSGAAIARTHLYAIAHEVAYAAASTAQVTGGASDGVLHIDPTAAQQAANSALKNALDASSRFNMDPSHVTLTLRVVNTAGTATASLANDPACTGIVDDPTGLPWCWHMNTTAANGSVTENPVAGADPHRQSGVQAILVYHYDPCTLLVPQSANGSFCASQTITASALADTTTQH